MAKKVQGKNTKKRHPFRFATYIFILSFIISVVMSFVSQSVLSASGLFISLLILLLIVFIGIIFDIVGVAVTTCDPAPFHSMAAKKNPYAKYALKLIKRAPFVATISNDVVGDISGIISGAAVGNVVYNLISMYSGLSLTWLNVLLSGCIAGLTVGGKAVGKEIAISKSKEVTFVASKIIYFFDYLVKLKWLKSSE